MLVKTLTWPENCHKLFDYESTQFLSQSLIITESSVINRENNQISVYLLNTILVNNLTLVSIHKSQKGFLILSHNGSKLWKVTKDPLTNVLKEGQYLKFGRKTFKVKSLVKSLENAMILANTNVLNVNCYDDETICRLCLTKNEENNPFVSPCGCKGSIKYAHIKCFQNYIRPHIIVSEKGKCVKYTVRNLMCEISKCKISRKIIRDSFLFCCVDTKNAVPPYIILEYNDSKKDYSLYLIQLNSINPIFKIGRSKTCDLSIKDPSVSRQHAQIIYNEPNFIIQDSSSKFGTLVSEKTIEFLPEDNELTLQVGKTLLSFTHDQVKM
ncbi:hypothetical protein SteCoe_15078 [Stentor coeruleus]|uniref:FHA domain-containing protein n=1 Tax=Stentor coeruleus TaxID=5963 RepID=A0A1R2C4G6_9CILI|nr:hypothetical protein SteCoe_15078 [Stentor coeruleus]